MRKKDNKYAGLGYTVWDIRKTLREAENVARWNPWLAHTWIEEARNQISLDKPFWSEFNATAERINARWALMKKFRWFNEHEFWELDSNPRITTYIELI